MSFTPSGSLGEIEMTHLSCYTCTDCRNGTRDGCQFKKITGEGEARTMGLENTAGIGNQKRKQEELKKKLRKKIKKGTNIVIYQGHGQWFLARACGPPKLLKEQEGKLTQLRTDTETMFVLLCLS